MLTISLLPSRISSQGETLQRDCTAPKPLEYLRVQGFANNEIRLTVRSKTLGPSRVHLLNESQALTANSQLLKDSYLQAHPKKRDQITVLHRFDSSRRNNQYADNLSQRRKNKCDRFRAFLIWLAQIEQELGWHSCPVADIFSYLQPTSKYNGKSVRSERLRFLVHPDGRMSGWDEKAKEFVCSFDIEAARAKIRRLLDITDELQVALNTRAEIGQDNRPTAFTRRARHTLLEAGAVMQSLCPSADLSSSAANARAITLTLPGSTPEAYRALAAYSSWLLNCLNQEIRDCGLPVYCFSVWELQKRGALHLHLCLGGNPEQVSMDFLEQLGNQLITRWFELLKVMGTQRLISRGGKTGRLPGIDMFARSDKAVQARGGPTSWKDSPKKWQSDNQPIKKNIAAYFSKYASKNVTSGNKNNVLNAYSPSRWWACNSKVRAEIKKWRFDYTVPYQPIESNQLIEECLNIWKVFGQYSYTFRIITGNIEGSEGESSQINVVNGVTKICYWDKSVFREVWEAFRDLKPVLSEVGNLRQSKDIQPSNFNYYKFYDNTVFYNNTVPCSLSSEPEVSLFKRVAFQNIPLST